MPVRGGRAAGSTSRACGGLGPRTEGVQPAARRVALQIDLDIAPRCRHKYHYIHAQGQTPRPQDGSAPATREPQSPSRHRRRSALRQLGLLRPTRLGPGQVRNGAPGARGRAAGQPQRHGVRVLASVVLSSPGSARARRARRLGGPEAGATAVPQARSRGDALPAAPSVRRRVRPRDGVGPSGSDAVWPHGPSPQRRARSGSTGKKTTVTAPTAASTRRRLRSSRTSSFAATRWRARHAAQVSAGSCSCAKGWRAGSIAARRASRRPPLLQPGVTLSRYRPCPSRSTSASSTCWPASPCHAERP